MASKDRKSRCLEAVTLLLALFLDARGLVAQVTTAPEDFRTTEIRDLRTLRGPSQRNIREL